VFFTNGYVNISDYQSPYQQVTGYTGAKISPGFMEVSITESLNELNITTDDGYILSNANNPQNTIQSFIVDTQSHSIVEL
jgi:hypothetical protein